MSRSTLRPAQHIALAATVAAVLGGSATPQALEPMRIENAAARLGLTFRENNFATEKKYMFETMGGGVGALDYNNDGFLDLLFLNGAPSPGHVRSDPASFNRLYRNNGPGRGFTDVTESSGISGKGIPGYPQGLAVGDYDNDGYPDVYVTNFGDNVLYHNNRDGTFGNVTARAGVAMPGAPFKASACWLDADNDGFLDLFVTRYVEWTIEKNGDHYCGDRKPGYRGYCRPEIFKPLPNALFRNNGDGTFTDVSVQSGISRFVGKGMGVAIADYDNDGWMDILVVNDNWPNHLYHNEGHGVFEEVSTLAGVWVNETGLPVAGMGCDFRDLNNDGLPDIFYTALITESFTLFVNRGKGVFFDETFPSGLGPITAARSGWSLRFMDWDNDGWKDIFVTCSHVLDNVELYKTRAKYLEPCAFYRNLRNGKLENASESVGPDLQVPGAHRGLAAGDFDNDGILEAAVSRLNENCAFFRRASGPTNNWLLLDLRGTKSNRDAIGARVQASLPSGLKIFDHVTTVNGIYSASDRRIHMGLGKEDVVKTLEIRWPSGIVQKIENIRANQVLTIEEPRQ